MKKYLLFLLLTSCYNTQLVVEKPKLQPGSVIHPGFEGYALTFKFKWDIVPK